MDKDLLVVSDCSVAFSRVLLAAMEEEPSCDGLSDLAEILSFHISSSRSQWQLEALQDHQQLLANVLGSFNCSSLDEVLIAPSILVTILFPSFINCEQCQVVSVLLVELGSLLVSYSLLLSRSIEHVLH